MKGNPFKGPRQSAPAHWSHVSPHLSAFLGSAPPAPLTLILRAGMILQGVYICSIAYRILSPPSPCLTPHFLKLHQMLQSQWETASPLFSLLMGNNTSLAHYLSFWLAFFFIDLSALLKHVYSLPACLIYCLPLPYQDTSFMRTGRAFCLFAVVSPSLIWELTYNRCSVNNCWMKE